MPVLHATERGQSFVAVAGSGTVGNGLKRLAIVASGDEHLVRDFVDWKSQSSLSSCVPSFVCVWVCDGPFHVAEAVAVSGGIFDGGNLW